MRALWLTTLLIGCGRGTGGEVTWTDPPGSGDTDAHTTPTGPGGSTDDTHDDTDCAGIDVDGDGADRCADCDDDDAARFPGAPEVCNGLDDDCDGELADGEDDLDGDGAADCAACDQAGFWEPTRDLEGDALVDMLVQLIEPQWCADYGDATEFMFLELDKDPATSEVECVYTGRRIVVGNSKPDHTVFNTEHSWPQSQGAGSEPARCDLHHLYPTFSYANSKRSAHPFGEVTGSVDWQEGGSKLGDGPGGATVFEPRDAHKGNVARSMLYFAHRYGFALSASELALYKSWHALDPVDDRERARSFAIAGEQVVPNPFVTCPELVDEL